MSAQEGFRHVLTKFLSSRQQPFAQHPLARFIRRQLAESVEGLFHNSGRYWVEGSAGKGRWAEVPWTGIFDRTVTETAQKGFYLVYLFKTDMSGLYLSLNQGVTQVRAEYKSDTINALHTKARDYLAQLGSVATQGLECGPIDLAAPERGSLGNDYQESSIAATFYPASAIPNDQALATDLKRFLSLYLSLIDVEISPTRMPREEDEGDLETENLQKLREHKRLERNHKLAAKAKRFHGLTCQACGFNFEFTYGQTGKGFIEAHHLKPLGALRKQGVTKIGLDPKSDFAMLCSNCHRMIHRTDFVDNIDAFIRNILNPGQT